MLKKPGSVEETVGRIERQRAITDGRNPAVNVTAEDVLRKYGRPLNLLCLIDATGSMSSVWETTKAQVREMIARASRIGNVSMKIVAYKDYCDKDLLEQSGWETNADPLLRFVKTRIVCGGGGDGPEAVEYALMKSLKDERVEQIVLIGDAPPHRVTDQHYDSAYGAQTYVQQCERLAEKKIRVFAFMVMGGDPSDETTEKGFRHIAELTGGAFAVLREAKQLIDLIVMTAASHIGGSRSIDEYLLRYGHGNVELESYGEELKALPPPPRK